MVNGRPLFPGSAEPDQLTKIFKILGTPTPATWPGMVDLPDYKSNFYVHPPQSLKNICRRLDKSGLELLQVRTCFLLAFPFFNRFSAIMQSMLEFDPAKRVSAEAALSHPYFNDLKKKA